MSEITILIIWVIGTLLGWFLVLPYLVGKEFLPEEQVEECAFLAPTWPIWVVFAIVISLAVCICYPGMWLFDKVKNFFTRKKL